MPVPHGSHAQSHQFDDRLLEQLACPVCFGALRLDPLDLKIRCIACQRVYPFLDGIPVLIPERAACPE
jgi:uncharacterized protein